MTGRQEGILVGGLAQWLWRSGAALFGVSSVPWLIDTVSQDRPSVRAADTDQLLVLPDAPLIVTAPP
ncbi:hypothetical protein F4556_007548 [Kitasatospora gansuensis]|uniref:Uncharacterized protein n=1 Tax=Kitasatospora gansuensis TaxID=258050 RepID=A0A7W7SK06_9ACTN|nr:hypothetical protein [Kitasatospora gansuensis]MBB4951894.1 hypothetical protein [Kitasatospora gansuensis]